MQKKLEIYWIWAKDDCDSPEMNNIPFNFDYIEDFDMEIYLN